MSDINCVTLSGRLTRDAELKYTQNGGAIVRFSMAVNRSKRNGDGSWAEEASYFDCVYFGKGAESVNSYLSRGRQVAVSGELRQSRWEQDGQTRSRVEVFVNNLSLLSQGGSKSQEGDGGNGGSYQKPQSTNQNSYSKPQNQYRPQPQYQAPVSNGPEEFQDDDIPF